MPNILRAVSNEMAAFKATSREFQGQMLSLQDILANTTDKCYQAQMGDIRQRSYFEAAIQGSAFLYTYLVGESRISEMVSGLGKAFVASHYEPRQLDQRHIADRTNSFAAQVTRMVQALDQLRQTQDTAEQQMQNSRQQATQV